MLEQPDGSLIALPPIEIVPAEGVFDYTPSTSAKATQEICPGRFAPEVTSALKDQAIKAHRALSCSGYSRSDFIVSDKGPVYLETNTLPGLTRSSLYPKALKAAGHRIRRFPERPDRPGGTPDSEESRMLTGAGGRGWRKPVPGRLKSLRFWGKYLTGRIKIRPAPPGFTLCLPGGPKVNAGGACALGCRGVVAGFRFDPPQFGRRAFRFKSRPASPSAIRPPPQKSFAGPMVDELVQWMVQDASQKS